jgi:urea transporter
LTKKVLVGENQGQSQSNDYKTKTKVVALRVLGIVSTVFVQEVKEALGSMGLPFLSFFFRFAMEDAGARKKRHS